MNFVAVAIDFAIVPGHSFNKRVDICFVQIAFAFVLATVVRSLSCIYALFITKLIKC